VSIRPPDLLDSEPQLRVYQIYPLGKVCVLFACPLVLACSSICLQVQGCSWHSKNNTNWRRCNCRQGAAQPLWCCSRAAQRRSSSNQVIPHSHRKIGNKPQWVQSCGNQSKVPSVRDTHPFTYSPENYTKNRLDLKIPTTSLSFCCSA